MNFLSRFGLSTFRSGQKEIIEAVLARKDVMAVLPTGGGKSLCYQYPAVAKNELVVVISPLIALMKDQVDGLERKGVAAGCIHSGQTLEEQRRVFARMRAGGEFILYVSPERAQKPGFQTWIRDQKVALFAVDEAHCVSQWGHDFREEYAQLRILKELRPDVPVLALTASATPFVLSDIARQLKLQNPERHVHGFYRSNLYYQVESCTNDEDKLTYVHQALDQFRDGRVIIYGGTRSVVEELAEGLGRTMEKVAYYHAGLPAEKRSEVQNAYARGETRILVATNAFGMGIDHPDVRLVVHYQLPANIDSLYQEMGRAGRDGAWSTCLLLYAKKDKGLQSYFIQSSKAPDHIISSRWRGLDNLVAYADGGECRHAEILTYYQDAERIERCGHCDVCDPKSVHRVATPPPAPVTVKLRKGRKQKGDKAGVTPLSAQQFLIFEQLRAWRKEKAKELDVPAFVVLSDKTLRALAVQKPSSLADLESVYGMGEYKIEKFGADLIREIGPF